jgi:hypothetical protein
MDATLRALPNIDTDPIHSRIDAALATALGIENDSARLCNVLAKEPLASMRLPNEARKGGEEKPQ